MTSDIVHSNMTAYFKTHDPKYVATDAEFIDMTTGQITKGRDEIGKMLHHIYHVAFDARAEISSTVITDSNAVLEATFTGKHIGEFASVPATGKSVRVPLCVVYELKDGVIARARIYMLVSVMLQQLQG